MKDKIGLTHGCLLKGIPFEINMQQENQHSALFQGKPVLSPSLEDKPHKLLSYEKYYNTQVLENF